MSARCALYEYSVLPDVPDEATTQIEYSEEDSGEEIITSKNSRYNPSTRTPIRNLVTHSPTQKTYSRDLQRSVITSSPLYFIAGFLIIPVCFFITHWSTRSDIVATSPKEWKQIVTKLLPHLLEKKGKFPAQKEDLWFQISSGLKRLSDDPKIPAVYLLTYDENSVHPSSCIVEIITTAANNFMLNKNGWGFLNGSLLTGSQINDPGELIEKIASTLKKHKIIVVTDVQNIPAQLAQGFHFLVDEYNPKIREAVYVLTLKIPSHLKNDRPVQAAENTLRESWKDLKYDLLLPLITRVTNQVLPVMAESGEITCPLITSTTTEIYI